TVVLVLLATYAQVGAQQSDAATQLIKVHLEPTIQIASNSASNVNIGFNSIVNYMNGMESEKQQFTVHSNRDFVVNVRTNAPVFSYAGNTYPAPEMPVNNVLFLTVSENNTGGNVAGAFQSFAPLSANPCDLLLNCKNGDNKTFSVNYRASPGTEFPAGDYTVGVIYTATQP
ncbi:MAG TPA: hypothetical protein VIN07_03065, partial [Flavipsychrobacter sp.]